jgi:hypothetical protein
MKKSFFLALTALFAAAAPALAAKTGTTISGDYVEVRTCDVYTGSCVANAQMNLEGKEAILVWSVRAGAWNGVALDGLKVIAIVRTDATLGDLRYNPAGGRAVLVVDAAASDLQKHALAAFARHMAGGLIREVAEVKTTGIEACIGACAKDGCAVVEAGSLVRISTRCFGAKDHLCGNEETFYPPLTKVIKPMAAFTELASYQGTGLNLTFEATGQRSAFIGTFAQ